MSYNIDRVRRAWERQEEARSRAARSMPLDVTSPPKTEMAESRERYIMETYNDFLIVGKYSDEVRYKVPYVVQADRNVVFGDEVPVVMEFVEMSDLTAAERLELAMGDAALGNTVLALAAGMTQVDSHVRHSKLGKLFRVKDYYRTVDVSSLSVGDKIIDKFNKEKTVAAKNGEVVRYSDNTLGRGSVRLKSKAQPLPGNVQDPKAPKPKDDVKDFARGLRSMSDADLEQESEDRQRDVGLYPGARALADAVSAEQKRREGDAKNSQPKAAPTPPKKAEAPKKRALDPKGDLVAQWKDGKASYNSKGVDDFGAEALSLMSDYELWQVKTWQEEKNAAGNYGMSGAADLKFIKAEAAKRVKADPVGAYRNGLADASDFADMTDSQLGAVDQFHEVMGMGRSNHPHVAALKAELKKRRAKDPLVNKAEMSDDIDRYVLMLSEV